MHRRARLDVSGATYHLLDRDLDLLSVDGNGNVGNFENKLRYVPRRKCVPNGGFDPRAQFARQGEAGLHHHEQKHVLVGVLGAAATHAQRVADVLGKRSRLDDGIDLSATEPYARWVYLLRARVSF